MSQTYVMNGVMKPNTASDALNARMSLSSSIPAPVLAGVLSTPDLDLEKLVQPAVKPVLLRRVIGEELRRRRIQQNRTLREVSKVAQVSLGYLSEVERGQKEASSELLAAICRSLNMSLSALMTDVAVEIARQEKAFAHPPTSLG